MAQNAGTGERITFPSEAKAVIDVTKAPYKADPSGKSDCTEALVRALDDVVRPWRDGMQEQSKFYAENPFEYTGLFEARRGGLIFNVTPPEAKILYFPAGTYLVSDTVRYTIRDLQNKNGFEVPQLIQFRGESEADVVIKLSDDNPRFAACTQRAVIEIMGGIYTNAAFHNSVENLTIDLGSGNPGAVGLGFFANNTGTVRHLTVRSSDAERRGAMGVAIRHNNSSAALLQHITVEGCDVGVFIGFDRLNTVLEHITVRGQRRAGVQIDRHNASLRGLVSENEVPALKVTGTEAVVAFVEGDLRGGSAGSAAIELADGQLFARDVETEGYRCALARRGAAEVPEAAIDEYVSAVVSVCFPEESRRSLALPVEETPHVPWENDHTKWACVNDFGAAGDGETDDTDAIRAAIASGKPVVYFQPGVYLIDDVIDLPASLHRLNFMKADLAAGSKLRLMHGKGAFRVAEDAGEPIVVEDLFAMEGWRGGHALVDHASKRTLILSDIHMHFCAAYRNSVTGGKVFIENVFAMNQFRPEITPFSFRGQQVWARQINPERNDPEIHNDGGSLWILGFKTEHAGTAFLTTGGGKTEVLGGTFNQLGEPNAKPTILNIDSDVSVVAGTTDWQRNSLSRNPIVEEHRVGFVRRIPGRDFPKRDGVLVAVPLYVGRATEG